MRAHAAAESWLAFSAAQRMQVLAPESTLPDGLVEFLGNLAILGAVWLVAFYTLGHTVAASAPQSSKTHENDRHWVARHFLGGLHAALVASLAVPPLMYLLLVPRKDLWFYAPSQQDVSTCGVGALDAQGAWIISAVSASGTIFISFTAVDVWICGAHGMMTLDYLIHHIAFITVGLLIRGHCMLPLNAAILLSMEASTPSLNIVLMYRNRNSFCDQGVKFSGVLFLAGFVVFRLGLGTAGVVLLTTNLGAAFPPSMATWQRMTVTAGVLIGTGIQWFWFPAIAKSFMEALAGTRESVRQPVADVETKEARTSLATSAGNAPHGSDGHAELEAGRIEKYCGPCPEASAIADAAIGGERAGKGGGCGKVQAGCAGSATEGPPTEDCGNLNSPRGGSANDPVSGHLYEPDPELVLSPEASEASEISTTASSGDRGHLEEKQISAPGSVAW